GPVNFASGEAGAIGDVVNGLAARLRRPDLVRLGELPTNPADPPLVAADIRRLREEVGWTPRFSLDEGLADTIAWWRRELTRRARVAEPEAPAREESSDGERAFALAGVSGSPR